MDVRALQRATPGSASAHFLVVTSAGAGTRLVEMAGSPITVGRSDGCDLRLAEEGVSGRHCRFQMLAGRLVVEDLGSTNGVLVGDRHVDGSTFVEVGDVVRVGHARIVHEIRDREEAQRQSELAVELDRASKYVSALLPPPLRDARVRIDWRFIPSVQLGGDAFGYQWLDGDRLAVYLLDVCGHGPSAALHSASILNLLRGRSLGGADMARPDQVLSALNACSQMDDHGGMYFTLWYGVYDVRSRTIECASAGHPPALLRAGPAGDVEEVDVGGLGCGMAPDVSYDTARVSVPPGSTLYVFSDGIFEIETATGLWSRQEFRDLIAGLPPVQATSPQSIERSVRDEMKSDRFDDDVSLVVARFP